MHVSRDRLARPVDISSMLQNAQRQVNLVVDVPGLQWKGLSTKKVSTRRHIGARKSMHRRYVNRSWIDKENQRPRTLQGQGKGKGKGKGKGSILPSWYPRTPLRDITAIVRAIERKRAKLYDDQTTQAAQHEAEASVSNTDQLKNEIIKSSSIPQVCKFVDEKGKEVDDSSTPQKNLLNSIEQVSQIWLEDRRKFEKTPAAKKAERKERVRVLMSMR